MASWWTRCGGRCCAQTRSARASCGPSTWRTGAFPSESQNENDVHLGERAPVLARPPGNVSVIARLRHGICLCVPRTAMGAQPLERIQPSVKGGRHACLLVPSVARLAQPPQDLQLVPRGCKLTWHNIHVGSISVTPLNDAQVPVADGAVRRPVVPRKAAGAQPLQRFQLPVLGRHGAHVLLFVAQATVSRRPLDKRHVAVLGALLHKIRVELGPPFRVVRAPYDFPVLGRQVAPH